MGRVEIGANGAVRVARVFFGRHERYEAYCDTCLKIVAEGPVGSLRALLDAASPHMPPHQPPGPKCCPYCQASLGPRIVATECAACGFPLYPDPVEDAMGP